MNPEEIFNLVKNNSKFINNNKNINNRWKKFVDAVYVICIDDNIDNINLNLKSQNMDDIIIYLKTIPLKNLKQNYFTDNISLAGCHISHTLCAKHALENNYQYILILEDDCCFNKYITDNEINKLIELRNEKNPYMINLSPLNNSFFNFINKKEFNIIRKPSALTHFVYLNRVGMNKLFNTIICPPPKDFLYNLKPGCTVKSRYFGADDFWMCFTNHYTLEVPDKTTLTCQYKPNREKNLNYNIKTNYLKY